MLTAQEIKRMPPEEVAALNQALGRQVLKKFFILFSVKWFVIIAGAHILGRMLNKNHKP